MGNPQTPFAQIRGLIGFICILLMVSELEKGNPQADHLAKLIAVTGNRLVVQLCQVIAGQTAK